MLNSVYLLHSVHVNKIFLFCGLPRRKCSPCLVRSLALLVLAGDLAADCDCNIPLCFVSSREIIKFHLKFLLTGMFPIFYIWLADWGAVRAPVCTLSRYHLSFTHVTRQMDVVHLLTTCQFCRPSYVTPSAGRLGRIMTSGPTLQSLGC